MTETFNHTIEKDGVTMDISIGVNINSSNCASNDSGVSSSFITQWETTSADESITLPFTGTNDFIVDWGDGSIEVVTTANPAHTYKTAGTYLVSCSGTATAYGTQSVKQQAKCVDVINWGSMGITNWADGVRTTAALNITATDGISDATTMFAMFYNIVGNALVVDVSKFDTSNVTNMEYMFANNSGSSVDVSGFDVSSLTNASYMFNNSSLSTAHYDALLLSWSAQSVQPNVTFHAGNATYTESAARDILTNAPNNWTIIDGGAA